MSRTLKILLAIGALGLCAIVAVSVYFLPRIVGLYTSVYGTWYDEAYNELLAVMNEHWAADDRVNNGTVGFYFSFVPVVDQKDSSSVMLDLYLETSVECTLRNEDPCDALAEEYARLAVANYSRLDDVAGIHVTVINSAGLGPFSMNRRVTRIYTSDWWQEELDEQATLQAWRHS